MCASVYAAAVRVHVISDLEGVSGVVKGTISVAADTWWDAWRDFYFSAYFQARAGRHAYGALVPSRP